MPKGYAGKILHVDLTNSNFYIEQPDDKFYRKYVGGACMGAYYVIKGTKQGVDALSPENVLVFAISPVTGTPISGSARHCVISKSPLTGGLMSSEAGGYWGPELKFAGFDAIVIKGKASKPVYLWIRDGEFELRDAAGIWGKETGDAQDAIRAELGDNKVRVAQIGPAGENLVRYANIANELSHFNGRGGMGAVMGSKNLKAIAVRGTQSQEFHDRDSILKMARLANEKMQEGGFFPMFRDLGTTLNVEWNQPLGGLPTKNWSRGVFDGADKISAHALKETILKKSGTCWACAQSCKRVVEAEEPYKLDPKYGGPEYETTGMCGSNLMIDNYPGIAKINEICNRNGMDTISFGGTVGFIMDCFDKGAISAKDTDGIEIRYGDHETVIKLAEMTAKREGLGDVIAEGTLRVAKKFGPEAEKYAVHVKGKEFPAHMPHIKGSLALIYAVNVIGPDHQSSEHDPGIAADPFSATIKAFGFDKATPSPELNYEKSRFVAITQRVYSLLDSLSTCHFCFNFWTMYGFNDLVDLVNAATGWDTNLWELMRVGERRLNLFRAFNAREGFTSADDVLPEKLLKPLEEFGPTGGHRIDLDTLNKVKEDYYKIQGWDPMTGNPTVDKLKELDIEWLAY